MVDRGPSMVVQPGRSFWPLRARPDDVSIEAIAHALSHLCRFGGHTRTFYSVAQHSVLVSRLCPPEDALWGLLHDAAEAYLGDVIDPLKTTWMLDGYRALEAQLQAVIGEAFGLAPTVPASVAEADVTLRLLEQRDLMPMPEDWRVPTALGGIVRIEPWTSVWARQVFLERFRALQGTGSYDARR